MVDLGYSDFDSHFPRKVLRNFLPKVESFEVHLSLVNLVNCEFGHDIMLSMFDQVFTDNVKWGHISQVAVLQECYEVNSSFYKCK